MSRPVLRRALAWLICAAGAACYLYYGIYKMLAVNFDVLGLDFYRGCVAAGNFLDGRPIYVLPGWLNPLPYFPGALAVFLPFSRLPAYSAALCWFAIGHALLAGVFIMLYRAGAGRGRLFSAAAASASVLLSGSVYQTLQTGNVNILVFAGLGLCYHLILRGREAAVPPLLAVFAALKLAPAALAAIYLRPGCLPRLRSFFLWCAAFALLSLVFFGLRENLYFIRQLPEAGRYSHIFHGTSLTFFAGIFSGGSRPGEVFLLSMGLFALLLFLWLRRPTDPAADPRAARAVDLFGASIIMTLVAPSSWIMYCALFAAPFYFVLLALLEGRGGFRLLPVFLLAYGVFGAWEFLYFHLTVPFANLTIREIAMSRESWPALYAALFSLHFLLDLALFFWALANRAGLCRAAGRLLPAGGAGD